MFSSPAINCELLYQNRSTQFNVNRKHSGFKGRRTRISRGRRLGRNASWFRLLLGAIDWRPNGIMWGGDFRHTARLEASQALWLIDGMAEAVIVMVDRHWVQEVKSDGLKQLSVLLGRHEAAWVRFHFRWTVIEPLFGGTVTSLNKLNQFKDSTSSCGSCLRWVINVKHYGQQ